MANKPTPGMNAAKSVSSQLRNWKGLILSVMSGKGTYAALVILVIVGSLLSPSFLTPRNVINVVRTVSVNGIVAVGMTLLILCGKFDLSAGVVVSMASVLAISLQYLGMWPAMILALLAGALVGAVNGLLVAYFNVNAFIATLATQVMLLGALLQYSQARFLSSRIEGYTAIGRGELLGVPIPVIIMLSISAFFEFLLRRSHFGRYIYAIGGNEEASRWSGVPAKAIQMSLFVIMGALSATAGIVLSSRVNYGASHLGTGQEFDAIISVLLGGTRLAGGAGSVLRTVVGVVTLGALTNILQLAGFAYEAQLFGKGLVFVLIVWSNRFAEWS